MPKILFSLSPEDEFLTPPQIAKLWGCSAETVRELIESGDLLAVNFSRGLKHPRYKSKRKWVDECTDRKAGIVANRLPSRRPRTARKEFSV